jgi:hypothetical protein
MTGALRAQKLNGFTLCYVKSLYDLHGIGVVENERMSNKPNEEPGDTIRLLRPPPRVFTDPLGRNVWMGEVEVLELEPVTDVNTDPYNSADAGDSTDPWSKSN